MWRYRTESSPPATVQPLGNYSYRNSNTGQVVEFPPITNSVGEGIERTCFDVTHPGPPFKTGGPFFAVRQTYPTYLAGKTKCEGTSLPTSISGPLGLAGSGWKRIWTGGFKISSFPSGTVLLGSADSITGPEDWDPNVNPNDLSDLGTRAYNKLRPKPEKVNLAQALYELREAPRMLRTSARAYSDFWAKIPHGVRDRSVEMLPKRAADHFLNVQFGWKPFLKDLSDTLGVVSDFHSAIEAAKAKNNEWQKRRFHEDVVESSDVIHQIAGSTSNFCNPTFDQWMLVPFSGSRTVSRQRMTRIWYEGSFKYYRPEFDKGISKSGYGAVDKAREMASVLGLRVNPTSLYRVTPWTWLIDWFIDVGGNVQRFEDLGTGSVVSRYFYLMRETFDRYEYRCRFTTHDGQAHDVRWYRECRVKRRIGGESNWGFSTSPGGLSAMQYAILAALGLSQR